MPTHTPSRVIALLTIILLAGACSFGGGSDDSETDSATPETEETVPDTPVSTTVAEGTPDIITEPTSNETEDAPNVGDPEVEGDTSSQDEIEVWVTPALPVDEYAWCDSWLLAVKAADDYDAAARRDAAALKNLLRASFGGRPNPTTADDTDNESGDDDGVEGLPEELAAFADLAAASGSDAVILEAVVTYGAASGEVATAAERAYRSVADARDAAYEARSNAWTLRNELLAALSGVEPPETARETYDAAVTQYQAADAAFSAAERAASDWDLVGESTIGASGWPSTELVAWELGWPKSIPEGLFEQTAALCPTS